MLLLRARAGEGVKIKGTISGTIPVAINVSGGGRSFYGSEGKVCQQPFSITLDLDIAEPSASFAMSLMRTMQTTHDDRGLNE